MVADTRNSPQIAKHRRFPVASWFANLPLSILLLGFAGCVSQRHATHQSPELGAVRVISRHAESESHELVLTAHRQDEALPLSRGDDAAPAPIEVIESAADAAERLAQLVTLAQSTNPALRRLSQEVAAAEARTGHIGKLPDPTVGANFFAHPIETAAGSQRANVSVMQMIPWLRRLDAQTQQAFFEALAAQQAYEAERLKIVGTVRSLWYRLYVLQRKIETSMANQEILQPLIEVANERVSTGQASQADVLLGTMALSKLEEQILTFRQQIVSTKAELNRVVGRDTDHPIAIPTELEASLPDWSHGMLRQIAGEQQPEIAAAELRTQATSWGIEVARLQRRPHVTLNASWFGIDDNRPTSTLVDVGRDAWSIGAQVSLPLWHRKNDAQEEEAAWQHSASHATVEEIRLKYDSLLRDLWEQAKTAHQTASLYRETLLPQARQTLAADQQSYANGTVDFDRLMLAVQGQLMIELGYHRAIGELAAVLARIQQAVGSDLLVAPVATTQLPLPR